MQSNDPGLFLHNAPFLQGFLREQDTKSEMKTCPVMTQILHNGSRRPGKVDRTFNQFCLKNLTIVSVQSSLILTRRNITMHWAQLFEALLS